MKKIATYRLFHLTTWLCIGVVIFGQAVLLVEPVAAQDPTPTSTEVSSDPTAELIISTPTPTFTATPEPTPTPLPPTATPTDRMVDFRVDDDEIDRGSCVEFSWVVRGDIDRVEFEKEDDGKDPILVATLDQREECPTADAVYKLMVRWLDGAKTTREIDIDVDENATASTGDDNTSGGSGSSSSGSSGSNNGSAVAPTPGGAGSFVDVTPIAVSTATPTVSGDSPQQVSYANAVMSEVPAPDGLLGSVSALPETGMSPPNISESTSTKSLSTIRAPQAAESTVMEIDVNSKANSRISVENLTVARPNSAGWFALATGGSVLVLIATVVGLLSLVKFLGKLR